MSAFIKIKRFADLQIHEQKAVVVVLSELLKAKKLDVMYRIFNVANPELIVTYKVDDTETLTNFKISDKSQKPFILIMKQYLNEAL